MPITLASGLPNPTLGQTPPPPWTQTRLPVHHRGPHQLLRPRGLVHARVPARHQFVTEVTWSQSGVSKFRATTERLSSLSTLIKQKPSVTRRCCSSNWSRCGAGASTSTTMCSRTMTMAPRYFSNQCFAAPTLIPIPLQRNRFVHLFVGEDDNRDVVLHCDCARSEDDTCIHRDLWHTTPAGFQRMYPAQRARRRECVLTFFSLVP